MIPPLIIAGIAGASAIGLLSKRFKANNYAQDVKQWTESVDFFDTISSNARLADGTPLLIKAIQQIDIHIINGLLEMNVTPDVCTPDGTPALFHVLKLKPQQANRILSLFKAHQANFNIMDSQGNTALFYTHSPIQIQTLCKYGTLINAQNAEGKTVLHLEKSLNIVDCLIESGADINIQDNNGRTPLHLANSSDLAFKLLKKKAHKNIRDNDGKTPLHSAITQASTSSQIEADEYYKIAELLLNSGADPNIRDNDGKTPLFQAIDTNNKTYQTFDISKRFVELLLQNSADPNVQDKAGNTPLHLTHYLVILELLLQNGANPNIQNYKGQTPLRMAQSPESRDLLLKYGAICN